MNLIFKDVFSPKSMPAYLLAAPVYTSSGMLANN